jgi:hypothetical protein
MKSSGSSLKTDINSHGGFCRADQATSLYPQICTKFRRQVTVIQTVKFACGLRDFVCLFVFIEEERV